VNITGIKINRNSFVIKKQNIMLVKINTDKTLIGDKKMEEYFITQVKEALSRYESQLTRIEIHLKDENGIKKGINDICCTFEGRLKGRKPIAVTCNADTVELAVSGAVDKIINTIETILGRLRDH